MTHFNTKHGHASRGGKTPTYKVWMSMIRRCTMPSQDSYKLYGGRGIKVCDRWLNSYAAFLEDMGERPDGASLDRINSNGHYEPDNCRWASMKEQQRNRRGNRILTYQGQSKTVAEWAEITGVHSATIRSRIDMYGWSVEQALSTPKRSRQEACKAAASARAAKRRMHQLLHQC